MRIVGGEQRGRPLSSPKGMQTRPTSDRARQAIFNILEHASWRKGDLIENADILDVFAGTGAMGLEALSRGARQGVFIEQGYAAAKNCEENIKALGYSGQAVLLKLNAATLPSRPLYIAPRTLVFLDPPYGTGLGEKSLSLLAGENWLAAEAICVLEMSKKHPENIPAGFIQHDARAYGVAQVAFLEWQGANR